MKLPIIELDQKQLNATTIAVFNVLAKRIGSHIATPHMSAECVAAVTEALNQITRRPNPAHGAPKPLDHNPFA